MENRKPYVLVGAVTLFLVIATFAFIFWLARFSGDKKVEYDIFFRQSVAGLATGSAVTFSGVPVGQVRQIALMPETPEFVRVRIEVQPDVPVLEGTTAALQGLGFTGAIQIQLKGAMRGAAAISTPGPYGVPVIPSTASGLGELMENAPQVLERASTLLARLNDVFDDQNRLALSHIASNLDKTTGVIAKQGPQVEAAMKEAVVTLKAATVAANRVAALSDNTNTLVSEDARPLIADLRATVKNANAALASVQELTTEAKPGIVSFSSETIPEANKLIYELQDISRRMGALSSKLDEDPLAAVTGGRKLPDYKPENNK